MTVVAVLGAGGGGLSATVELTGAGHSVRLWNRRAETIKGIRERGSFEYDGVFGRGTLEPVVVTDQLDEALDGADAAVVCLPSIAHEAVFKDLATCLGSRPLILNPGHTGGALHARAVWQSIGAPLPPVAEFSTLTYVARVHSGVLSTTGRAKVVRVSALPGGDAALELAISLFPGASVVANVLASSLSNVNLVLHPPGALLALGWVEATGGNFTFYVDGVTPSVARVMAALDDERRAVARGFDLDLPSLLEEMYLIGTVEEQPNASSSILEAIQGGEANRSIKAPHSTGHRYYREDFPFGVLPFVALAEIAGVEVPLAKSLLRLATAAMGDELVDGGLTARSMGIAGMGRNQLLDSVQAKPRRLGS